MRSKTIPHASLLIKLNKNGECTLSVLKLLINFETRQCQTYHTDRPVLAMFVRCSFVFSIWSLDYLTRYSSRTLQFLQANAALIPSNIFCSKTLACLPLVIFTFPSHSIMCHFLCSSENWQIIWQPITLITSWHQVAKKVYVFDL